MPTAKTKTQPGLLKTGIGWLDQAVEHSGLPPVLDTGGANMLLAQLTGQAVTDEYFQRLPILFRRIGRTRIYEVDDVVAYAKVRRTVPRKLPEPRKRRGTRELESA
jgi:hypothetical protein